MYRSLAQAATLGRSLELQRLRVPLPAQVAGLAAACVYLLFADIGQHGVLNGSEALYAEAAREMLASGQIAIPTLNGVPYLEKPPLTVWLLAIALQFAGPSELALRSVSALCALATVTGVIFFSRLLGLEGSPLKAGLVLATSFGMVVMARAAMPDAVLTALFGCACFAFAAALERRSRGYARIAYGAIGVAALAKGLLAIVLFGAILAVYAVWQSQERQRLRALLRDPLLPVLVAAPVTLWLVAVEGSVRGASLYWLVDEQMLRFLGLREPNDYYSGSLLYYVPRLFLAVFPWAGALGCGWWATRGEDFGRSSARAPLRRFLWLCVWIPFAFFTLSQAKANYYIVICLPAMALLTAAYLPALMRAGKRRALMNAVVFCCAPAALLTALWWWRVHVDRTPSDFFEARDAAPLIIGTLVALGAVAVAMARLGWPRCALACLAALVIPLQAVLGMLARQAEPFVSARPMAQVIQQHFKDRPVFLYQDFEAFGALPFYLQRTVPVIDSRSADLLYGYRQMPWHPAFASERQALGFAPGALVVVLKSRAAAFEASALATRAVPLRSIGWARLYELRAGAIGFR